MGSAPQPVQDGISALYGPEITREHPPMSARETIHIRDPIHGTLPVSTREIKLIDHHVFQRLRNIKQLGFADLSFPGATHTRYSHPKRPGAYSGSGAKRPTPGACSPQREVSRSNGNPGEDPQRRENPETRHAQATEVCLLGWHAEDRPERSWHAERKQFEGVAQEEVGASTGEHSEGTSRRRESSPDLARRASSH